MQGFPFLLLSLTLCTQLVAFYTWTDQEWGEGESLALRHGDGERSQHISLYACMEFSKIKKTF